MIKICALNKATEEEARTEEEVTKEALEQIALQQYAKALELHRNGNISDATQLLKDLLDTELLDGIKKPAPGEKVTTPLLNLKYLCYKNLACMLGAAGDAVGGIAAYYAAADLDDTDLTLWHRLGVLCMRARRYVEALASFQRGLDLNPKHWPCLDKIITLLMGLNHLEDCVAMSYMTLTLDPGYLRALVYRRHIYKKHPYIRSFMEYVSSEYKWDETIDEEIDEAAADNLVAEAAEIHETYLEQQKADSFKCIMPILPLHKPIANLTWESVGESLVDMHHYMTENSFSHACHISMNHENDQDNFMEVCENNNGFSEKDNIRTEDGQNSSDKKISKVTDIVNTQAVPFSVNANINNVTAASENDPAMPTEEASTNGAADTKKKIQTRRRGSALGFLQQWEWYYKRQPRRKKPTSAQERLDDNIYDMLRMMIPRSLTIDPAQNEEQNNSNKEPEKLETTGAEKPAVKDGIYFDTDVEHSDVKQFITKFKENKHDIIDILHEYLFILAGKWKMKWSRNLTTMFVEANKCYNTHIDPPLSTDDHHAELIHYALVNLQGEEITVNSKLFSSGEGKHHELGVIESIGMTLILKPHIFENTDILELMLRYLWVKLHIYILNKNDEMALNCLYQLRYEFEGMGEYQRLYQLEVCNFSFRPAIHETEIFAYIKFLTRNTKLSTVLDLYDRGCYEAALSIVLDSFEHCKNMDRKQEEEMSLDFAAQLVVIIDSYWSLGDPENCLKWSFICLHEALKNYFRYTSGSQDYEKWTLTVVKILTCMEQVLTTEGLSCLETISQKEIGQGLEDLIRIIGHQVETNATEMPFGTVSPWIIMHCITQREEDQGRGRAHSESESADEIPNPLMILFFGHEQLGNRGWCCQSDAKLLYFIMDTVVPQLRAPAMSKCLEYVCQHMEQCVYCLYGHPERKNKVKYLADHNVPPRTLDWERAQQVYEIFRPPILPELEGKSGISTDTEQLYLRIIALLPEEYNPQKYVPDIDKFIKGVDNKLPTTSIIFPYKMRDIYFLLGDYYFKKEEHKMAIKYNVMDVIINNDRLESWAEISLAKAVNLSRLLNSCKNLNNEKEFLYPAKSIIRCFKQTLYLDPTHCNVLIEYGMFVYTVHSFCSRLLKQASESLSMDDFESLEKQKEDMLDTTHICFTTVMEDMETQKGNEEAWLNFYMLGKVAEKRNRPPAEYLNFYMRGVKSLHEANAVYPLKINSCSPAHLSIEVLELHYRIHATILKYIEQHENKPIPSTVGKAFSNCIEEWKNGPFVNKKFKKDTISKQKTVPNADVSVQAANIQKRSISDTSENVYPESKKMKLDALAAKVKRSASYDTQTLAKTTNVAQVNHRTKTVNQEATLPTIDELDVFENKKDAESKKDDPPPAGGSAKLPVENNKNAPKKSESTSSSSSSSSSDSNSSASSSGSSSASSHSVQRNPAADKPLADDVIMNIVTACVEALEDCASRFPPHYKAIYRLAHYHFYYKKGKNIERCRDLMLSTFKTGSGQKLSGLFNERKTSNFFNNVWKISLDEVDRAGSFAFHMNRSVLLSMEILKEIDDHKTLLDLSLHLQRIPCADKKYLRDSDREELAQQALSLCLQSLKGQLLKFSQQGDLKTNEVERKVFNSMMLDIYRYYQRTQKQPSAKQFTALLIEAFKLVSVTPITENMNLVDLSMKYCQSLIQTLKQQATQASKERSQNALKRQTAKSVATVASSLPPAAKTSAPAAKTSAPAAKSSAPAVKSSAPAVKSSTSMKKSSAQAAKSTAPAAKNSKTKAPTPSTSQPQPKSDFKAPLAPPAPSAPKMPDVTTSYQNLMPLMNDATTAAALSYLSNISALAGYTQTLQNTLQPSLQNRVNNSFEAEFYRQLLSQSMSSYNMPPSAKKQKRAPRRPNVSKLASFRKPTVSAISTSSASTASSSTPTTSTQKVSPSMAPSMGTVLSSLPPSMASLSTFGASTSATPAQAHMSTSTALPSQPPLPPQETSPGKTLQEKLAERQKSSNPPQTAKTGHRNKTDTKKSLPFSGRPKPSNSDEVIVLDDDD